MANQAQAANDESPADSEELDVDEVNEAEDDAPEDVEGGDEPPEDEEEAAARAAKEAEEGEGEKAEEEKPEEATPKALKDMTPEELQAQLSESQLRRVAMKFANKTMAAARRAEKSTGEVKAVNEKLTGEVTTYRGFVDQLQNDPLTALKRLPNFTTLKDFVQRCVAAGATAETKPQDEIAALRKRLDERDARIAAENAAAAARASQERVYAALEKEPERWDLVLTRIGKAELWDAITEYTRANGRCPNAKVFELADRIEAELSKDVSATKKFAGPAQKGTSTAAKAQPAVSKTGKPTGKPATSTPAARANEADETEEEREARIIREMREAGELTE